MHGQTTCYSHGGASPQARMAAAVRLAQAAMEKRMTRAVAKAVQRRARRAEKAAKVLGIPVTDVDDNAVIAASAIETWRRYERDGLVPRPGGGDAA